MRLSRRVINILITSILIISLGTLSVACIPMTTEDQGATAATDEGTGTTGEEQSAWSSIFSNYGTWIWLVVLAAAFYFLLIRPQRVRSKRAQELMSSLQRGDEVVTIGGFYGRIKDIRDNVIIITIASGVDVKVNKSSVSKRTSQ